MKKSMIVATLALAASFALETRADDEREWDWSPVGFGIAAPVQLPYTYTDIKGARFGGFYGYNRNVYGFDMGFVGMELDDFKGCQLAAFTWSSGAVVGAQFGLFANIVHDTTTGFQFGLANVDYGDVVACQFGAINSVGAFKGVQVGMFNWDGLEYYGLQFGIVNYARGKFEGCAFGILDYTAELKGAQIGLFNSATTVKGVQVGLVNACETISGFQLGLVNMITESPVPLMVLANGTF